MGTLNQLPRKQPREVQLCDRLIDLCVQAQADANRMRAAGGACMAQSDTVHRAAWAIARAAWSIGGSSPTLQTFFPGVGTGKRPEDAPPHGTPFDDLTENDE